MDVTQGDGAVAVVQDVVEQVLDLVEKLTGRLAASTAAQSSSLGTVEGDLGASSEAEATKVTMGLRSRKGPVSTLCGRWRPSSRWRRHGALL